MIINIVASSHQSRASLKCSPQSEKQGRNEERNKGERDQGQKEKFVNILCHKLSGSEFFLI